MSTRAILRWGAFGLLMLAIAAGEVVFFMHWDLPGGRSSQADVRIRRPSNLNGVPLGAALYQEFRCADCHGRAGVGGVPNPNYLRGSAPALDLTAERLMLFDGEDAAWVIERITEGADPAVDAGAAPPFRTYPRFRAQLESVRNLLRNGRVAGRLDPEGPPPRDMPAWRGSMSDSEREAVIAYLISLYDWEDQVSSH